MQKMWNRGVLALLLFLAAAGGAPSGVDKMAVGQDVAVTKAGGGVVEGKVASVDAKTVKVTTGPTTRLIPKDQIVNVKFVENGTPASRPPGFASTPYLRVRRSR